MSNEMTATFAKACCANWLPTFVYTVQIEVRQRLRNAAHTSHVITATHHMSATGLHALLNGNLHKVAVFEQRVPENTPWP